MQTYEMVIRTINKHKRVVISCPRAVMAVFDIIYPEIRGHVNRSDSFCYISGSQMEEYFS